MEFGPEQHDPVPLPLFNALLVIEFYGNVVYVIAKTPLRFG